MSVPLVHFIFTKSKNQRIENRKRNFQLLLVFTIMTSIETKNRNHSANKSKPKSQKSGI